MKSIAGNLAQTTRQAGRRGADPLAAHFVRFKQEWALQVAADRHLPETALRIALALPKWLNSQTRQAWPSQATLAREVNTTDRAVRAALKVLEDRGHLACDSQFRGGRQSNRYRIVFNDVVLEAAKADEGGTAVPVSPEARFRGAGNAPSDPLGTPVPHSPVATFRGTPERTPEKRDARQLQDRTRAPPYAQPADPPPQGPPEPQVTAEKAQEILARVFGSCRLNADGYLES